MVDSSTTIQPSNESSDFNETTSLPLIQTTPTPEPFTTEPDSSTEIFDSPHCLEKENNEKPQDLALILMKNYSR